MKTDSKLAVTGIMQLRRTHFLLWRAPGKLRIGKMHGPFREVDLIPVEGHADLFATAAADLGLEDGQVYHYWFEVRDTNPYRQPDTVHVTDPFATAVDRRVLAKSGQPAAVILYREGELIPCDPGGETVAWPPDDPSRLAPNHRLVIYELPTRWVRTDDGEHCNGTFQDVLALVEPEAMAPNFKRLHAVSTTRAHLRELGVNALELLPPADHDGSLGWGYGTANYFAASYYLGKPDHQDAPTASTDLARLIRACHQHGIRFFLDAVMAFARNCPLASLSFPDFFVQWGAGDPEQADREGFGGDLFRYNYWPEGTHPLTGSYQTLECAREYLKAHIEHWIRYYQIDGIRLDSVNNIRNADFVQDFTQHSRATWRDARQTTDESRFLVVGEELSVPIALVQENRLEGLWNEQFKWLLRKAILGQAQDGLSFEETVRRMIDCRQCGFSDGTQAVNYLTSHDTGGDGNERLYNYLDRAGVVDKQGRMQLAFACLMTAVGIPMILAGDEFADQHDLPTDDRKEIDPVNYHRLQEPWRHEVFHYVRRLIALRTTSDALCVNDTEFFHSDGPVLAWQRGTDTRVVVAANFSDTPAPGPLPNWPAGTWRDVMSSRTYTPEEAAAQPLPPWSARIYTTP
ncbi:MAG: alpha-amylase family glycosyl hydrolase [Candidatus Xenobia bacterium]